MLGRTMVLPAGNYTLSFEAFGCTASNASDKTPSSSGDVVAFMTGKDNVDVTNTTLGGNTFHSVSYTFDVATDNTAYEFGIKKLTNESKAEWCQIKNVKLVLNSENITPIMNNDVNSFVYSGNQTWHTNTWSTEGQGDGSRFQVPFHELWRNANENAGLSDATIKGTYTPTQSGVYKVSAWVRAVNERGGEVTGVSIFVGDAETDACTGSAVINGKGRLGTYTAMADGVAGTSFEYGCKIKDAEVNWLAFKNVTITYLGEMPQSEIDALLALVPTGAMNASVQSTLNDYVTAFQNNASVANYNALSLYLPTAQGSADAYSQINTAISNYAAKAALLDAAGFAAYDASAIQTKYNNRTYETFAEADAELSAAYYAAVKSQTTEGSDWTGLIVNPSFESDLSSGWIHNGMGRQNNTSFGKTGTYYAEKWQPNGTIGLSQTINGLPAGVYRITADAKARLVTSARIHGGGIEKAVKVADEDNNYSVEFACFDNSNITIGFEGVGTEAKDSWICVDNFTLTLVSKSLANADDYAVLATAIENAEDYTLGFDAGEYAPYNNVAGCEALAAAKAIDPTKANAKTTVTAAIQAINDATWTVNTEEVNAFYDGTFNIQDENTTPPTALAGWNNPEGIRQLIKNTETNPGLNSATDKAAVFAWGNTTVVYGNTVGYTMPLAAHTLYELSFKTCGWRDGDMGYVNVTVLNSANKGLSQKQSVTATKRVNEENPWNESKYVFMTDEAGDYTFGMWTSKHTVFTDLVLKKATSITIDENATYDNTLAGTVDVTLTRTIREGANTLVLPFDMTQEEVKANFGDDAKVYVISGFNATTSTISFAEQEGIIANAPCVLEATKEGSSFLLTDRRRKSILREFSSRHGRHSCILQGGGC